MALEEVVMYEAVCDGPSDLGPGCPFEDRYLTVMRDASVLALAMQEDGWYIEMSAVRSFPKRYGEVMCPECKEAAGE